MRLQICRANSALKRKSSASARPRSAKTLPLPSSTGIRFLRIFVFIFRIFLNFVWRHDLLWLVSIAGEPGPFPAWGSWLLSWISFERHAGHKLLRKTSQYIRLGKYCRHHPQQSQARRRLRTLGEALPMDACRPSEQSTARNRLHAAPPAEMPAGSPSYCQSIGVVLSSAFIHF